MIKIKISEKAVLYAIISILLFNSAVCLIRDDEKIMAFLNLFFGTLNCFMSLANLNISLDKDKK